MTSISWMYPASPYHFGYFPRHCLVTKSFFIFFPIDNVHAPISCESPKSTFTKTSTVWTSTYVSVGSGIRSFVEPSNSRTIMAIHFAVISTFCVWDHSVPCSKSLKNLRSQPLTSQSELIGAEFITSTAQRERECKQLIFYFRNLLLSYHFKEHDIIVAIWWWFWLIHSPVKPISRNGSTCDAVVGSLLEKKKK